MGADGGLQDHPRPDPGECRVARRQRSLRERSPLGRRPCPGRPWRARFRAVQAAHRRRARRARACSRRPARALARRASRDWRHRQAPRGARRSELRPGRRAGRAGHLPVAGAALRARRRRSGQRQPRGHVPRSARRARTRVPLPNVRAPGFAVTFGRTRAGARGLRTHCTELAVPPRQLGRHARTFSATTGSGGRYLPTSMRTTSVRHRPISGSTPSPATRCSSSRTSTRSTPGSRPGCRVPAPALSSIQASKRRPEGYDLRHVVDRHRPFALHAVWRGQIPLERGRSRNAGGARDGRRLGWEDVAPALSTMSHRPTRLRCGAARTRGRSKRRACLPQGPSRTGTDRPEQQAAAT